LVYESQIQKSLSQTITKFLNKLTKKQYMGRFALVSYRLASNQLSFSQKLLSSQKILISSLKVSSILLFALLLLLIHSAFIPEAYAATSIVPKAQCSPENIMAYMYRPLNTHGAIDEASGYEYVLCYSPMHNSATAKTLSYGDATSRNVCWGGNEIFSLTSARNAHFGLPRYPNYLDNDIYDDWCFGYLSCYAGQALQTNEQLIGKMENVLNTHITDQSSADSRFSVQLQCKEPVCDEAMFNQQIPYPNLYTFDSQSWPYELFGTANFEEIVGFSQTPAIQLSENALLVSPEITIEPRISQWSLYNGLQFFMYAPGITLENQYSYKFEVYLKGVGSPMVFNLADYAEKPVNPSEWIRIRIPFYAFGSGATILYSAAEIDKIRFTTPSSGMFIDSMSFISPVVSGGNMFQNFYCTREEVNIGDFTYMWISNLDDGSAAAQNACQNIHGYTATGTKCCGDDLFEIYPDTQLGCFYSRGIPNASVFSFVNERATCIGDECTQNRRCVGGVCPEAETISSLMQNLTNTNRSSTVSVEQRAIIESFSTESTVQELIQSKTILTYSGFAAHSAYYEGYTYAYQDGNFFMCGTSTTPNYFVTDDLGQSTGVAAFWQLQPCQAVGDFVCTPQGFSNRIDNVRPMQQNGAWYAIQSASERNTPKPNPVTGQANAACCPQSSCYFNGVCHANMGNIANSIPVLINGQEQLCQNGEWTGAVPKISLDGLSAGFCSTSTQCLVSPSGITGSLTNPKCINSQEKFDYAYCDGGNWTSTTNLVAQRMVDFAEQNNINQYTLFCDDLATSLNYLGMISASNSDAKIQAEDLLRGLRRIDSTENLQQCNGRDCVNNFCVLTNAIDGDFKSNSILLVGTSSNIAVTNNSLGLGAAFDLSSCSESTTQLTACASTGWFYEGKTKIAIYKQGSIGVFSATFQNMWRWFRNLFVTPTRPSLSGVFAESKMFERVYIAKTNKVDAFGFTETIINFQTQMPINLLYVQYTYENNYADAHDTTCTIVADISAKLRQQTGTPNNLACHRDQNRLVVNATHIDESSVWTPLTAELRFQ
jgi:hypothetical protein